MTAFATFWTGRLPALISACLASFPARGADLTLFAYHAPAAPPGLRLRDAREILAEPPPYRVGGKPSPATLADRFRYELLAREPFCWVDADMVALRPERIKGPVVWGRQAEAKGKALVNNAVLALPPGDPVLADMLAAARHAEGTDVSWGALGPYLLTEVAERHGADASAAPPGRFFPVAPDDFWRLFDPASREAVEAETAGADLVHLWSELLRRAAYDFDARPPRGCYLDALFAEAPFPRRCGADEIAALIARWKASAP